VRLADTGLPQQEHGRQLDRVLRVNAERELPADVLEHGAEIGQCFEQRVHLGEGGGLDREALAAEPQHLLVERAERFARAGGETMERLLHGRYIVDVLEACYRNRGHVEKNSMMLPVKQTADHRSSGTPAARLPVTVE
jgi:hypothetical protein